MKMSAARIRSLFKRYDSAHNEVFRFAPDVAPTKRCDAGSLQLAWRLVSHRARAKPFSTKLIEKTSGASSQKPGSCSLQSLADCVLNRRLSLSRILPARFVPDIQVDGSSAARASAIHSCLRCAIEFWNRNSIAAELIKHRLARTASPMRTRIQINAESSANRIPGQGS